MENASGTKRALRGLAVAAVVAALALFTVILPAEFGYDPTGIGRRLGLMAMADARAEGAASVTDVIGGNEDLKPAEGASPKDPTPLPNPAVSQVEASAPRTETIEITLGFDEKTEIKAVLGKTKVIVYDWSVEGGEVYVDFHGHDPALGNSFWVRYEEADGVSKRSGSLVAPFGGEHGWYWLNVSQTPVKIRLTVTGYQDKLVNYGLLR